MKKIVLPIMALLFSHSIIHGDYYDPCEVSNFHLETDFLWWRPCVDNTSYAFETTSTNGRHVVRYKDARAEWEPGVRVFAGISDLMFVDFGVTASYTYINPNHSTHSGDGHHSNLLHPFFVQDPDGYNIKCDWEIGYHEWDILFSFACSCGECHLFRPYAGIAGVVLNQEFDTHFYENGGGPSLGIKTHWGSDYWGAGLRAGAEYSYCVCDGFKFFAWAHGTLMAGDNDAHHSFKFTSTTIKVKDDEDCHFVPGYHIGSGLEYEGCICCWEYSIRVGYEFLEWRNLPVQRIFISDDFVKLGNSTTDSDRTLGFHGFFVGIGFHF